MVQQLSGAGQELLAGLFVKLKFQLGPLVWLGIEDKIEDGLGKDGAVAVKAVIGDGDIAVCQQVGLNDGLEGGFGGGVHDGVPSTNRACSRRSMSKVCTHSTPTPVQTSGILIFCRDCALFSSVTTV